MFVVVIMLALGNGQLQKAEQKTERLLAFEEEAQKGQVSLKQLLGSDKDKMWIRLVNF